MNKIEVCPQHIFSFDCEQQLTQDIFNQVLTEQWRDNCERNYCTVDTFLHKKDEYKQLIQWFEQCLQHVQDDKQFKFDGKFTITQCWANKTIKQGYHHGHTHSNSILSGIFYLTNSNPTYFNGGTMWMLPIMQTGNNQPTRPEIDSVRGRLLIFPSSLYHGTNYMNESDDRYSMSFNTFISGSLGQEYNLDYVKFST